MDNQGSKSKYVHCNSCNRLTWHNSLSNYKEYFSEFDPDGTFMFDYSEEWEIFQCNGCKNFIVRVATDLPWNDETEYIFYPEITASHHTRKNYQLLPSNLRKLYFEVVNSYNNNSLLLCAFGLRALIEGLCADKGILEGPNAQGRVVNTLEGKINSLQSIVPVNIVRNLHGLRFLGNQALHELDIPPREDIELALIVIEDIFNVVYDLDYKSDLLYKRTINRKNNSLGGNDEFSF